MDALKQGSDAFRFFHGYQDEQYNLVPSPSETWFRGMSVGGSFRRMCLPSRDAANWLPSRFSLSVETRRPYGWFEDGVPRCAALPSSNLVPFGRCGDTREEGNTVAKSLVALYRVGTH